MSTPAEIIDKALLDTHTDANDYDPQTDWLDALNIVSNEVNNSLAEMKEDYFWDRFFTDTVSWQSEYDIEQWLVQWAWILPKISVNIKEINKLFVKYDPTSDYYTRVDRQNPSILWEDMEYYKDKQVKNRPFFYVQDRSLFIYPAPTEVVTDGLKMNAIYNPPEIEYTDSESFLSLQPNKHYIYSLGMEWQIYKSQWKINEAQAAESIFSKKLTEYLSFLRSRINWPIQRTKTGLECYR